MEKTVSRRGNQRLVVTLIGGLFLFLTLPLLPRRATAQDYYVATNAAYATNCTACCTQATPCSFQSALICAQNSAEDDTVHVQGGTYNATQGLANTLIYSTACTGGNITIEGWTGTGVAILDGNGARKVVRIDTDNSSECCNGTVTIEVKDITFQNGLSGAAHPRGGGLEVHVGPKTTVYIHNCAFEGNTASEHGGGLEIWGNCTVYNVTMSNNTIHNNTAGQVGGGACIYATRDLQSLTLSYNTVYNNSADVNYPFSGGGGVSVFAIGDIQSADIANNTVYNNTAKMLGGGVSVSAGNIRSTIVFNNTVHHNRVTDGQGGGMAIGATNNINSLTFTNNELYENSASSSNVGSGNAGGCVLSALAFSSATVANNTIYSNNAAFSAGGLYLLAVNALQDAFLYNNLLYNNTAGNGGGGFLILGATDNLYLINNTITQNHAGNTTGTSGGGVYLAMHAASAVANVYNNIIYNNTDGNNHGDDLYCYNQVGATVNLCRNDFSANDAPNGPSVMFEGTGPAKNCNIAANPLFTDAANEDFTLEGGSPCIDAGSNHALTLMDPPNRPVPAEDLGGNNRILYYRTCTVDIGAYETRPNEGKVCSSIDYGELACCEATNTNGGDNGGYNTPTAPVSFIGSSERGCEAGCIASVTLKWQAVRGATGYLVYEAGTGQLWKWVKDGSATGYTFHNLPCGRTYRFYIETHSGYGNSRPSKTVAVVIPPCSASGGTGNPVVSLVWPKDQAGINYDDFAAADYLVVFAWNRVENANSYLLWLKLGDGEGHSFEGNAVLFAYNGLMEAGDLAGIYFALNEAGWNSLVPYEVSWQVSALSDPEDLDSIIGTSERQSFTFNPAP